MCYYDHATYIALELNAQVMQEQTKSWQLEQELALQRQIAEQPCRGVKISFLDWARQFFRDPHRSEIKVLGLDPKQT